MEKVCEKVDETICKISNNIQKQLDGEILADRKDTVKMITALAELLTARAATLN